MHEILLVFFVSIFSFSVTVYNKLNLKEFHITPQTSLAHFAVVGVVDFSF